MSPIEIAYRQTVSAYRRYQASMTASDRECARQTMIAWHRALQLERINGTPCDPCDGCSDLDEPSCGVI